MSDVVGCGDVDELERAAAAVVEVGPNPASVPEVGRALFAIRPVAFVAESDRVDVVAVVVLEPEAFAAV